MYVKFSQDLYLCQTANKQGRGKASLKPRDRIS